jgi:hypothetical protein
LFNQMPGYSLTSSHAPTPVRNSDLAPTLLRTNFRRLDMHHVFRLFKVVCNDSACVTSCTAGVNWHTTGVRLAYSPLLEFHTSLRGAHEPTPEPRDRLREAYAQLTRSLITHNLHAACAAGAPHSCLGKRLRTTYTQRDVAYTRVVIGLLTRELTRSLRISKQCLRTQQKRYETLGTDYKS